MQKLGDLLPAWAGMTGALLPWWGWLLVLQALFTYALFEYVRIKAVPVKPQASVPAPMKKETVNAAPPKDRWGTWAHIDTLKVSDAACLWAGFLPGASYMFDKAQSPAIVGAERLITSELANVINMDGAPYGSDDLTLGTVTRFDLNILAERKGLRPPFLFPTG